MKSSALTLALLCSGQALASLNCTVAAPTLTKRLCESDACAAYDTVEAGANLHAACRADCSTDDDPWLKLYDGTYVRASSATVSGCRYFCQPYNVLGLPRCHEEAGSAKPDCSSTLKPRSPVPIPLAPEAAPLPAIASLCNLPVSSPVVYRRTARSRLHTPRFTNSTLKRGIFYNATISARNATILPRDNGYDNRTVARQHGAPVFARAVIPRNESVTLYARAPANESVTLYARSPRNETGAPREHGSILVRAPFANNTLPKLDRRAEGRTPPVVRRAWGWARNFYA
ncbi:hypothetical protein OQA88_5556 [Cercophora sp. LCS_1]